MQSDQALFSAKGSRPLEGASRLAARSRARVRGALIGCLPVLLAFPSFGTTYTWSGSTTSNNWSSNSSGTTNWQGNVIPVSAASTQLVFSASTNPLVPVQDIASPFVLNSITLGGSSFVLEGGPLQFSTSGSQPPQILDISTHAQTVYQNISLANDLTIGGTGTGNLNLTGTIDGAHALTVSTTAITNFAGTVGGSSALSSVTSSAGTTTQVSGAGITTTGSQTYNGPLVLGGATTLASTGGGSLSMVGTVDGSWALTLNTSGTMTFGSSVGGSTPLYTLTTGYSGQTIINGGSVSTTNTQAYQDPVTLGADTTFSSTNGEVSFSKLDSASGTPRALTIGASEAGFSQGIGTIAALASLTSNAPNHSTTVSGSITTVGAQSYNSVYLSNNVAMTSTAGGDITFNGSVSGGYNLTVNTSGSITFKSTVGAGSLTLVGSNVVAGDITSQSISQTSGSGTFTGTLTASGTAGISLAGSSFSLNSANAKSGLLSINDAGSTTHIHGAATSALGAGRSWLVLATGRT
jgi:hypothetical protein